MVWSVVALILLILIVASIRWPNPLIGLIGLIVWSVPLMMLGIREVSHQAALLLVILGAPALCYGASALMASRSQPGRLRGAGWRRAVVGTGIGASFVVGGMLLLFPAVKWPFDSLYGRLLLASTRAPDDFDTGNRIHEANILMGRSALHRGRLEAARSYLLAAGRTPGSPQLNSFGPSMRLAKEMLEAGERETVLEYLALCGSFWKSGRGRLDDWSLDIKEGRSPNFGDSLNR
jgi:hypothetical protein